MAGGNDHDEQFAATVDQPDPKGKGAWYLTYTRECPICGRGDTTRIRMHTPRPEDPSERYEYVQYWDGCNA